MKKAVILLSVLLHAWHSYAQIDSAEGIFQLNYCDFSFICKELKMDTASENIWIQAVPRKTEFNTAYSPDKVLITDDSLTYPPQNHSYFDLILPNQYGFGIIVGFRHRIHTDTLRDGGYIEISYDDGKTWTNVIYDKEVNNPMVFNSESLYTKNDTLIGGIPGFSGTSEDWMHTQIQWIWAAPLSFIDPPSNLYLRFHFISDSTETFKDGWMIDDLTVSYAYLGSGIKSLESSVSQLKIQPNPVDLMARIQIENPLPESMEILVLNALGQVVLTQSYIQPENIDINVADWKPGVYQVLLQKDNRIISASKMMVR